MSLSKKGARFIHGWEGFREEAYQDGGGVWTIGYGHTLGVKKGLVISRDTANKLFLDDVKKVEDAIQLYVDVDINQGQFDVLVSLVFNIGITAFKNSTLLKVLNDGDYLGVPQQIARWNIDNGKRVNGLLRRRWAEGDNWINSLR